MINGTLIPTNKQAQNKIEKMEENRLEIDEQAEDSIQLRSEEVQEVLGDTPHWILRRGIIVLSAFVVILLLGSWFFKYPQTISAPIVLTSPTPSANIVAKVSGGIAQLFIADGAVVHKGDRLAVIENPASINDVFTLIEELEAVKAAILRFETCQFRHNQLQLGNLQGYYSSLLLKLDTYNQFIIQDYYPRKIASTEQILLANRRQRDNTLKEQEMIVQQHELQKRSFDRDQKLKKKELIADEEFEKAQRSLLQSQMTVENSKSALNSQYIQILQLESSLDDLKQQYEEKKTNLITDLNALCTQLETEIKAWRMNYLLESPIEGTVTFTSFWANNQHIQAGKVVFSIVPKNNFGLIGMIQLPASGAGRVKPKQTVNIRFDNYPDQEFGIVKGTVKRISLVPNEEKLYIVEVALPNNLNTTYGKQLAVSLEMSGNAEIITEDIRLLEHLIQPLKSILKNNL